MGVGVGCFRVGGGGEVFGKKEKKKSKILGGSVVRNIGDGMGLKKVFFLFSRFTPHAPICMVSRSRLYLLTGINVFYFS